MKELQCFFEGTGEEEKSRKVRDKSAFILLAGFFHYSGKYPLTHPEGTMRVEGNMACSLFEEVGVEARNALDKAAQGVY